MPFEEWILTCPIEDVPLSSFSMLPWLSGEGFQGSSPSALGRTLILTLYLQVNARRYRNSYPAPLMNQPIDVCALSYWFRRAFFRFLFSSVPEPSVYCDSGTITQWILHVRLPIFEMMTVEGATPAQIQLLLSEP